MPIPPTYSLGQIADLLSSHTAFSGMPRSLALRVVEDMAMCEYKTGDLLTQEGADNRGHLMLVVSGEALITSDLTETLQPLTYRRAQCGHFIGEVGFVDGQPHSATCTALTPMHVAVLERAQLTLMLERQPLAAAQIMAGLLKIMAQRLRHSNVTARALEAAHIELKKELTDLKNSLLKK